jgi:hypothetical protein
MITESLKALWNLHKLGCFIFSNPYLVSQYVVVIHRLDNQAHAYCGTYSTPLLPSVTNALSQIRISSNVIPFILE